MSILVLGASGMLGHKVIRELSRRFEVAGTVRDSGDNLANHPALQETRLVGPVDAERLKTVAQVLQELKPSAVVNCIGIVKQRLEAKAAIPSIKVNALFPHQLAEMCVAEGTPLVHISTDCVFSGTRGNYKETDLPDPVDLYGRTKLLGELDYPNCLTLRTSIIGWELKQRTGLLEWFASQRGRIIKGYRNAIYSGVSTTVLAQLIGDLLEDNIPLDGIYHVASRPISKYSLLVRLRNALGWKDITIEPDDAFECNRSLSGKRFEVATGWTAPAWNEMIAGIAAEWPQYERWRETTS